MEFKINPASFSGIFPVPTAIVDENIRLASVVLITKELDEQLRRGKAEMQCDLCHRKVGSAK